MNVQPVPNPWAHAPVLRAELEPIWPYMEEESVSEIAINRPGEVFIERLGAKEMEYVVKRELTRNWIRSVSVGVASATNQVVNEVTPVLSAALPSGERFQCVLPPETMREIRL
ncbi:MAG: P-type DNA transfer ATPase VirB11, partial [Mesorhizobium sp.]